MPHHKPNSIQPMSTPVHQWLQNCSVVSAAALEEGASFPFANQHSPHDQHQPKHELYPPHAHPHSHHHGQQQQQQQQQQQHQQHTESVQPYAPYSHILDDSDKALLATIQLGPGSADRTLSSQTTNTTITTTTIGTTNDQQITMYSIPALLPGMENSHHHPSADWEPKQQQQQQHHLKPLSQPIGGGYHSPLICNLTPMTELESMSSGQINNGNDDSQFISSHVFNNRNHLNDVPHQHQTLHNAINNTTTSNHSNSNLTATLPGQGTPPPHHHHHHLSAMPHSHQHQHHRHHHHQYGAVDQLSAAFLHLTHLYHPLSLSPSASPPPFPGSPCSPSGTPFSSSYPPSSPSPSLASPSPHLSTSCSIVPAAYHGGSNKSMFGNGFEPGMHSSNWSPAAAARPLATRSLPVVTRRRSQALLEKQSMSMTMTSSSPGLPHSPIMTRRRSQALLSQNTLLAVSKRSSVPSSMVTKPKPLPFARLTTSRASLAAAMGGGAHSSIITSPSSPLNPSGLSGSSMSPSPRPLSSSSSVYTPLLCEICKKEYANNSTLRRHAKIHAYANASTATRKICNPPRPSSAPVSSGTMGINPVMSSSMHSGSGSPGVNTEDSSNMSSTLEVVNAHLLSSFWPYHDAPSPSTIMTANASASPNGNAPPTPTPGQLLFHQSSAAASAAAVLIAGYNPGYDPTIRKPECVGCNKPFARRDTVILHIKNQKRKWDQLCALLPALAASASNSAATTGHADDDGDVSADGDDGDEDDADIKNIGRCTLSVSKGAGWKAGSTAAQRRSVRQKKAHPFREAEKLWQSTLQKKKVHFGAYKKPPSTTTATTETTAMTATAKRAPITEAAGRKSKPLSFGDEGGAGDGEFGEDMYVDNDHQPLLQHHYQTQGDVEMMNVYMADNINNNYNHNGLNEMEGEDEDRWPSQKAMETMDNQTKILWMMRMAAVPPCWSERKVRIFGLQGEVEESVLQDG